MHGSIGRNVLAGSYGTAISLVRGFIHPNRAGVKVDVINSQRQQLTTPQTRRRCRKNQRAVLLSSRIAQLIHAADVVCDLLGLRPRQRLLITATDSHSDFVALWHLQPFLRKRWFLALGVRRQNALDRPQRP